MYATVYSNLAIVNDDRYELSYTNLHCEPKKNSPKCLCHIFCKTRPIRIKKMVYIIANLFNFVVQKRKLFHLNGITSLHYFVKIALAFCKWTVVNWDDVKRQRGTNYEWFDRTFVVYVMWEIYAELYSLWRDTKRTYMQHYILRDLPRDVSTAWFSWANNDTNMKNFVLIR